jgi:ribosomal-protein-alanine N-acetyltransferase
MRLTTSRFLLRDLVERDRTAFVAYQRDPRYLRLYDLDKVDGSRVHDLFDLFISWQQDQPRRNYQLGIFDRPLGRLCGVAGLRQAGQPEGAAVLGLELTPDNWGRYRLAIEAASALIEHGFQEIGLRIIIGNAASGNMRVEKLARWFGAEIVARRSGPAWMAARGWSEVDWALTRDAWERTHPKSACESLSLAHPQVPSQTRRTGR